MASMGRPTRKIPMQKRDSREKLNVTFTKRRVGLFRKASELSRLCDAQVAVLVSSPNGKCYHSFAPSSVDSVLDAFLAGRTPAPVSDGVTWEAHRLAAEVEELEGKLRRAKELRKGLGAGECPWEALRKYEESVTTPDELRALYEALSELKAKYEERKAPKTNSGAGSNVVVAVSPSQSYTSAGNYNFPPVNDHGACTAAAFPLSVVRGLTNNAMHHRQENHSFEREFPELGSIERKPSSSSSSISWDEVGMESGTTSHWFSLESLPNSVFLPLGN